MTSVWQLQEAKTRLSEVIEEANSEEANSEGPQIITLHGAERAVILSITDYRALTANKPGFREFLLGGPNVDSFEVKRDRDTGGKVRGGSMICRLGAGLWLFCFQFFVGEQIARLGWTGHYSMTRNYISDLGAVRCDASAGCSSLHWVMNGSFVLQGWLIVFGAVLVRGYFPAKPVYRIALALLVIAGVGVLEVGMVPEDVNFRLHALGAMANFLGGNLAMILLGWAMVRRSSNQAMHRKSWITFALGSVGLLATFALAFRGSPSWTALGWSAGAVERLAAYPLPLWLTWTGYLISRELA
jgi:antitoxin Phd